MLLEEIATTIGLTIDQPFTMILIVIIGYLLINEAIFAKALMLLLFTMVYNTFLKAHWQIPLPPASGLEGWAFPSGHMHSAFVFWGWLAFDSKNRYLMALIFVLLSFTGFGLVHRGYHYPLDIVGAVCFGAVTLTIFHVINLFEPFKNKYMLNGLWLSLAALFFILITPEIGRKIHIYQGLGALIGFTVGGLYAANRQNMTTGKLKEIGAAILTIFVSILIFKGFDMIPLELPKSIMLFLMWFFIAFWVAGSKRVLRMPAAFFKFT
ncbi:MAG: hypothetical protein U1E78_01750 [Gammaproteobacteria bacterium]